MPENNSIPTKFANFLQSIPNDDDISSIYSVEKKRYVVTKNKQKLLALRRGRLALGLKASWTGYVGIRIDSSGHSIHTTKSLKVISETSFANSKRQSDDSYQIDTIASTGKSSVNLVGDDWVQVFLVLEGKRLIWWESEEQLDDGKVRTFRFNYIILLLIT